MTISSKLVSLRLALLLMAPYSLQSEVPVSKDHHEKVGPRGPRGYKGHYGRAGTAGAQGIQRPQGTFGAGAPAGYLSRSTFSVQTILEHTLLPFTQEIISPSVNITASGDNRTFTIVETGVYQVSFGIVVDPRQVCNGIVTLYKNGLLVTNLYVPQLFQSETTNVSYSTSTSAIISAAAGDEITVRSSPTDPGITLLLFSSNATSASDWLTISRLTPG